MDKIAAILNRNLPGASNRGLRREIRAASAALGERSPAQITDALASRIALAPWGRSAVLAALEAIDQTRAGRRPAPRRQLP